MGGPGRVRVSCCVTFLGVLGNASDADASAAPDSALALVSMAKPHATMKSILTEDGQGRMVTKRPEGCLVKVFLSTLKRTQ